jgi:hypothetical protein
MSKEIVKASAPVPVEQPEVTVKADPPKPEAPPPVSSASKKWRITIGGTVVAEITGARDKAEAWALYNDTQPRIFTVKQMQPDIEEIK